jgi:hypothetical protein
MPNDKNLKQVYQFLRGADKAFNIDYADFALDMANPDNLKQVHKYLGDKDKEFTVDFDTFQTDMGLAPKKKEDFIPEPAMAPMAQDGGPGLQPGQSGAGPGGTQQSDLAGVLEAEQIQQPQAETTPQTAAEGLAQLAQQETQAAPESTATTQQRELTPKELIESQEIAVGEIPEVAVDKEGNPFVTGGKSLWNVFRYQLPASYGGILGMGAASEAEFAGKTGRRQAMTLTGFPQVALARPKEFFPEVDRREYKKQNQKAAGEFLEWSKGLQEQGAEFTGDLVSTLDKIDGPLDALNWFSYAVGQAVGQIPASMATFGMSSFIQETGNIYLDSVQKIADERGISMQEVIERGLDEKAIAFTYGMAAAVLDRAGAGAAVKSFGKNALGKELRQRGLQMLKAGRTESITEGMQTILEQIGTDRAAGKSLDEAVEDIDWKEVGEAAAQGFVGSGSISGVGQAYQQIIGKDEQTTGVAPETDVVEGGGQRGLPPITIDLERKTAQPQEQIQETLKQQENAEEVTPTIDETGPQEGAERGQVQPLRVRDTEQGGETQETGIDASAAPQLEAPKERAITVFGAPYTKRTVKDANDPNVFNDQGYQDYKKGIEGLAQAFGLEAETDQTIGGWTEQDADLQETSLGTTANFKSEEDLDLFMAMKNLLSPEQQDAVLSSERNHESPNSVEFEIEITDPKAVESIKAKMKEKGLDRNFSFIPGKKKFHFFAQNFADFVKFADILEENRGKYGKAKHHNTKTKLVGRSEATRILRQARDRGRFEGKGQESLRDYLTQAEQEINNDPKLAAIYNEGLQPTVTKEAQVVEEAPTPPQEQAQPPPAQQQEALPAAPEQQQIPPTATQQRQGAVTEEAPTPTPEVTEEPQATTQIKQGDDIQTGKPVTIQTIKNPEKAPDEGSRFGQDVEPAGDYVGQNMGNVPAGWQEGSVTLNNPLVIEVDDDTLIEYKRELSKQYDGKTGQELTAAIQKDGYDGIITKYRDTGETNEIVVFPKQKATPKETKAKEPAKPKAKRKTKAERELEKKKAEVEEYNSVIRDIKAFNALPKRSKDAATKNELRNRAKAVGISTKPIESGKLDYKVRNKDGKPVTPKQKPVPGEGLADEIEGGRALADYDEQTQKEFNDILKGALTALKSGINSLTIPGSGTKATTLGAMIKNDIQKGKRSYRATQLLNALKRAKDRGEITITIGSGAFQDARTIPWDEFVQSQREWKPPKPPEKLSPMTLEQMETMIEGDEDMRSLINQYIKDDVFDAEKFIADIKSFQPDYLDLPENKQKVIEEYAEQQRQIQQAAEEGKGKGTESDQQAKERVQPGTARKEGQRDQVKKKPPPKKKTPTQKANEKDAAKEKQLREDVKFYEGQLDYAELQVENAQEDLNSARSGKRALKDNPEYKQADKDGKAQMREEADSEIELAQDELADRKAELAEAKRDVKREQRKLDKFLEQKKNKPDNAPDPENTKDKTKRKYNGNNGFMSVLPGPLQSGVFSMPFDLFHDFTDVMKRFIKKYFTSEGLLPRRVFDRFIKMSGETGRELKQMEYLAADLRRAIKKHYDNRLTNDDLADINAVLKGELAYNELPNVLQEPVKAMRDHVDTLSKRMVDDGVISGPLVNIIEENLGSYLNRSYRLHDAPQAWRNYISRNPKGQAIRNQAEAWIRQQFAQAPMKAEQLKGEVKDLQEGKKEWKSQGRKIKKKLDEDKEKKAGEPGKMSTAQREELINRLVYVRSQAKLINKQIKETQRDLQRAIGMAQEADISDERIDGIINNLLDSPDAPMAVLGKSKLGAKDLGILKNRKDIAEPIRMLMGEYKEPLVNYQKSVVKMINLIANHKFLEDVRAMGMGDFLFEKETGKYATPIAGKGSSSMAPLTQGKTLYTTKDIADAFENFNESNQLNWFMRNYMRLISTAKFSKTVLSVMTHVRNIVGNLWFLAANGHLGGRSGGKAIQTIANDLGKLNRQDFRDRMLKYIELGVINEDSRSGELKDVINDVNARDLDIETMFDNKTTRLRKKALRLVTNLYQAEDNLFKIYAFEKEVKRYAEAYGDTKTRQEIEELAAENIRNTYPTYSLVSEGVKQMRKFPITGSFVSFPAEVLRTTVNTVEIAVRDIKEGNRTNNAALRNIGIKRLSAFMLTMASTALGSLVSKWETGTEEEEEDALRRFVPPWSVQGTFIFIDRPKNGKAKYIDMTYTDPHSLIKDALMHMVRGKDKEQAAIEAVVGLAEPFIGEDLVATRLLDINRNITKDGKQIYNPEDDAGQIAADIWKHMVAVLEPGSASSFRRIWQGIHGKQNQHGKVYDPVQEIVSVFSGHRVETLDVLQSYPFRMKELKESLDNSSYIYRQKVYSRGKVSKAEMENAYERANKAYMRNLDEARKDYAAALTLGANKREIDRILAVNLQRYRKSDIAYIKGLRDYIPLSRKPEIKRERQRK